MRISQGQSQRVSGIRRGQFLQREHPLYHFGHGQFLGVAVADDRLLHFTRGNFENLQATLGHRRHGRAASLTHDQRGLYVLREKQPFNRAHRRRMLVDCLPQGAANSHQTFAATPFGGTFDRALIQRGRHFAAQLHHAITRAAQ